MLRLMSSCNYKLYSKFCGLQLTDLACHVQSLCTDSDAIPHRVTSLRRRRSARRFSRSVIAEHNVAHAMTDISSTDLSRMQSIKQHQIVPAEISISSLKHQLDDAVSMPHPHTELEFPSDILAVQKSEAINRRDQARNAFRPMINPMDTSVVLFPGQSSHFVGMGAKLLAYPAVEKMYRTASGILGYNLLDVCLHGPKDVLSKTVHSQPAVLVTSLAAVEKLKEVCPRAIENCVSAAGYDIGEYTALVFAGAMSFEDAVRVVKVRASAMQAASHLVPSGMIKVYFGASGRVGKACHLAKIYCTQELNMPDCVCAITAYLYPGCKIISGNREALEFIDKNRHEFGIKKVDHLPVSGAFHSRLMHSTMSTITQAIAAADLQEPVIPVHSNATSHRYHTVDSIRHQLVNQLWKPLQWEQTMHVLYGRRVGTDFPLTFEVGPGRQLGFILQQINAKAYAQYDNIQV